MYNKYKKLCCIRVDELNDSRLDNSDVAEQFCFEWDGFTPTKFSFQAGFRFEVEGGHWICTTDVEMSWEFCERGPSVTVDGRKYIYSATYDPTDEILAHITKLAKFEFHAVEEE